MIHSKTKCHPLKTKSNSNFNQKQHTKKRNQHEQAARTIETSHLQIANRITITRVFNARSLHYATNNNVTVAKVLNKSAKERKKRQQNMEM